MPAGVVVSGDVDIAAVAALQRRLVPWPQNAEAEAVDRYRLARAQLP